MGSRFECPQRLESFVFAHVVRGLVKDRCWSGFVSVRPERSGSGRPRDSGISARRPPHQCHLVGCCRATRTRSCTSPTWPRSSTSCRRSRAREPSLPLTTDICICTQCPGRPRAPQTSSGKADARSVGGSAGRGDRHAEAEPDPRRVARERLRARWALPRERVCHAPRVATHREHLNASSCVNPRPC